MPTLGPVSPAAIARSERLDRPARPPEPPPPAMMPDRVQFSPAELGAVHTPPPAVPVPPQVTLSDRLRLDVPIGNMTALIPTVLTEGIPTQWVRAGPYLDAVRDRFLTSPTLP